MIELFTTWDAIVNAVGASVMLAFGVWVWTLKPRTRSTRLLAVFAVAAGAAYIPQNLIRATGWHLYALYNPYLGAVLLIGGLALLGLVRELLKPLKGRSRRLWHLTLGVTGALVLVPQVATIAVRPSVLGELSWQQASFTFGYGTGIYVFYGSALALAVALSRRYRHPPAGDPAGTVRTRAVLVSAALVLWPAFYAGRNLGTVAGVPASGVGFTVWSTSLFGGFLLVAGLWLANAHALPERSREARNLALLTLGVMLGGVLQGVFVRPHFPVETSGPLWGLIRLATVVVLGYAILRHEVLGIEAKFRWGLSKTTVAGIFVAVFFVASEGAQVLFADVAGNNELLGVIAAGALVFAISPLQRMADRFAAKAVPGGAQAGADAEERFRGFVEATLADGEITPDEEYYLLEKAEELSLTPTRAYDLRREVEEEDDGGSHR